MADSVNYEVPKKLELYLASLATKYKKNGSTRLLKIITNAHCVIEENCELPNWDGQQCGHAIHLYVPENIYHEAVNDIPDLAQNIRQDLNGVCNVLNEHIEAVFIELEDGPDAANWRERSGVFIKRETMLPKPDADALKRLWGDGALRVFLSHKSEYSKETGELKDQLSVYGASCFVAHQDIKPMKKHVNEMELALSSMHVMVALLTTEFSESEWTDQEIGVAIGRGIPVIPVRLGKTPYGFIERYQGVYGIEKNVRDLAKELFELFMGQDNLDYWAVEALIAAIQSSTSFDLSNRLAGSLPHIRTLSLDQANKFLDAYNGNVEAYCSFGLGGNQGLRHHLERVTGDKYEQDEHNKIMRVI